MPLFIPTGATHHLPFQTDTTAVQSQGPLILQHPSPPTVPSAACTLTLHMHRNAQPCAPTLPGVATHHIQLGCTQHTPSALSPPIPTEMTPIAAPLPSTPPIQMGMTPNIQHEALMSAHCTQLGRVQCVSSTIPSKRTQLQHPVPLPSQWARCHRAHNIQHDVLTPAHCTYPSLPPSLCVQSSPRLTHNPPHPTMYCSDSRSDTCGICHDSYFFSSHFTISPFTFITLPCHSINFYHNIPCLP